MANQRNNRNSGYLSQKKASTAYKVGDLLSIDSNGFLVPGGTGKIVGTSLEAITSASSDYASTRDLVFTGFKHDDEFIVPVITGTATQTLVGEVVNVDSTDPRGADVSSATNAQLQVVRIIDTATIVCRIVIQTA